MSKVIVVSDWYNALYDEGHLQQQGKPEYLDGTTLSRVFPDAEYYSMPDDVYEDVLDGAGYPDLFTDLPVARLEKHR